MFLVYTLSLSLCHSVSGEVLPHSPQESVTDGEEEQKPAPISSPIRLTPERLDSRRGHRPMQQMGKDSRRSRGGDDTTGSERWKSKLSVRDRLYLSKSDIGT